MILFSVIKLPLSLSLVVLGEFIVAEIVVQLLTEHHGGPLPVVGGGGDLNLLYVETLQEINEEIKIHLLGRPGARLCPAPARQREQGGTEAGVTKLY